MRKVRFADSEDMVSLSKLYQSQGWESFTEERIVHLLESSHYILIEENGVIIAFLRYLTDDFYDHLRFRNVGKDYRFP